MRQFINNYLEALSPLITLFVIIFTYLQKKAKVTNALFFHFLLSSLFCLWIVILSYYHKENIYLYTISCIVSFFTLTLYFFVILTLKKNKTAIIILSIIYIVFYFVNILFWEDNTAFNSIGFATESIFILIFSFIYFRERLLLLDLGTNYSTSTLLVVLSFFFYYAGSFFIFLTYKLLTQKGINTNILEERKSIGTLWGIHNIIYFISCLIASVGILWKKFQTKYIS